MARYQLLKFRLQLLVSWLTRGWVGCRVVLLQQVFTLQVIIALLLSVTVSDALHLAYPGWAALSSFAVMSLAVRASLTRAGHRIVGTFIGGGVALILTPILAANPYLLILFCACCGGVVVWIAVASSRAYAWILGAVTAMMVLAEAQTVNDTQALFSFALERLEEVMIGCALCVFTVLLFHPLNDVQPGSAPHQDLPESKISSSLRLQLAILAGITLALVASILLKFSMAGFWQAMVSVLAILILPNTNQDRTSLVKQRMQQRFAGCFIAAVLSLLLLPLLRGSPSFYIITLTAGLWLGSHLQQKKPDVSYLGRQFTIAWIIVFIQDQLWLADVKIGVIRCLSILLAVTILALVMVVGDYVVKNLLKQAIDPEP